MRYTLIVKPTNSCNFSCKYCYEEKKCFSQMSNSTLENIVSKAFSYVREGRLFESLDFFAGLVSAHGGMESGTPKSWR